MPQCGFSIDHDRWVIGSIGIPGTSVGFFVLFFLPLWKGTTSIGKIWEMELIVVLEAQEKAKDWLSECVKSSRRLNLRRDVQYIQYFPMVIPGVAEDRAKAEWVSLWDTIQFTRLISNPLEDSILSMNYKAPRVCQATSKWNNYCSRLEAFSLLTLLHHNSYSTFTEEMAK